MDWETQLSEQGYRITEPRRLVMQVLSSCTMPLSPLEIHERARRTNPQIGMVSVYRALELFSAHDLVRRVHLEDGCHGYVLASPGHHHAMICRRCEQTVEFSGDEDLSTLIARVEVSTGFVVEDHLLQFFGLCPRCRSKV